MNCERFLTLHFVIQEIIDENDIQGLVFDDFDGKKYLAKFKDKSDETINLLKKILNDKHCFALGFDTYSLEDESFYLIFISHHEKYDNGNIKSMFNHDAFIIVSFEEY